MCLDPDKAMIITLATLVLRNMLRQLSYKSYTPEGYINMETENGEKKMLERQFHKVCQRVYTKSY